MLGGEFVNFDWKSGHLENMDVSRSSMVQNSAILKRNLENSTPNHENSEKIEKFKES